VLSTHLHLLAGASSLLTRPASALSRSTILFLFTWTLVALKALAHERSNAYFPRKIAENGPGPRECKGIKWHFCAAAPRRRLSRSLFARISALFLSIHTLTIHWDLRCTESTCTRSIRCVFSAKTRKKRARFARTQRNKMAFLRTGTAS